MHVGIRRASAWLAPIRAAASVACASRVPSRAYRSSGSAVGPGENRTAAEPSSRSCPQNERILKADSPSERRLGATARAAAVLKQALVDRAHLSPPELSLVGPQTVGPPALQAPPARGREQPSTEGTEQFQQAHKPQVRQVRHDIRTGEVHQSLEVLRHGLPSTVHGPGMGLTTTRAPGILETGHTLDDSDRAEAIPTRTTRPVRLPHRGLRGRRSDPTAQRPAITPAREPHYSHLPHIAATPLFTDPPDEPVYRPDANGVGVLLNGSRSESTSSAHIRTARSPGYHPSLTVISKDPGAGHYHRWVANTASCDRKPVPVTRALRRHPAGLCQRCPSRAGRRPHRQPPLQHRVRPSPLGGGGRSARRVPSGIGSADLVSHDGGTAEGEPPRVFSGSPAPREALELASQIFRSPSGANQGDAQTI